MKKRPNLLLIITDQQSATMMSCAGNSYVKTPAMDWLADSGVRFERAYCTNPVCVPSRFSLMTGRYPSAIGQRHNAVDTVDKDRAAQFYGDGLGWLLRKAGYETVYAGKQHLPCATAEDCGFEVLEMDERDRLASSTANFVSSRKKTDKPFALVASFINPHDICYMAIRDSIRAQDDSKQSRGILERGKREVAALDEAMALPEGIGREDFFKTICPPLPENHQPQQDEPESLQYLFEERAFRRHARENYTAEDWRLHRWAYANLTRRVDAELNILFDALRVSGRERDTVVIFTSDHGDHDSSHKLEHKTVPYREATRIPLILRPAGGLTAGVVNETNLACNGLDILPTLCDYGGAKIPGDIEGRSLRPFAEGIEPEHWREALLIETQFSRSINTGDWQYTLFDRGQNREQLYDLRNDPGQTRNHASDPANREVLEKHRQIWAERLGTDTPIARSEGRHEYTLNAN